MNCIIYKNGIQVFSGTTYKARAFLHTTSYTLHDVMDSGRVFKGCTVVSEEAHLNRDEKYKTIVSHLECYGNTVIVKDYKYHLNRLRKDGWKIRSRQGKDEDGVYWIIEGIKKEETQ